MYLRSCVLLLLMFYAFSSGAQLKLESYQNMVVDSSYDKEINQKMQKKLDAYKDILEKEVTRVIGYSTMTMTSKAPESLLSNFLADRLLDKANQLTGGKADISIINLGGIRAPLNEGNITVASVYRIMPFENELVILTLKGSDLLSVIKSIVDEGGEGVSNLKIEIKSGKLESVIIKGKPLDVNQNYVVATMDYLADGNSGMTGFLKALERKDTGLRVRDVYIEQIEAITAKGEKVSSSLDGRIKILENE